MKLNLGEIYNQADPRAYFNTLEPLKYLIPELAKPVFGRVMESLRETRDLENLTVLDLGCSYGVNAWLLKYGLSMPLLYDHYSEPRNGISREDMIDRDIARLEGRSSRRGPRIVGMDSAERAITYAVDTGLLDDGVIADLEQSALRPEAADKIREADLIITTGCVGYVTETTFRRLLDCFGDRRPWIASFVLRMFPYDNIARALEEYGLETQKLEGEYFVQRRFGSDEERKQVLDKLEHMGLDSTGLESTGRYFAEFYLSRPASEIDAVPLRAFGEDAVYTHA